MHGAAVIAAVCLCDSFAVSGRSHGSAEAVHCVRSTDREILSSMIIADSTLVMQAAGSSPKSWHALDSISGAALVKGIP